MMVHKLQIESLYGAIRREDAYRRIIRIIENAETEIEIEAATKYFRLLVNNDLTEAKAIALKRISGATRRSAG